MEIATERGDKSKEIAVHLASGQTYKKNNQVEQAIEQFKKAMEISKESEDHENEIMAHLGLGNAYNENNQTEEAIQQFNKALEIARYVKINKTKQLCTSC